MIDVNKQWAFENRANADPSNNFKETFKYDQEARVREMEAKIKPHHVKVLEEAKRIQRELDRIKQHEGLEDWKNKMMEQMSAMAAKIEEKQRELNGLKPEHIRMKEDLIKSLGIKLNIKATSYYQKQFDRKCEMMWLHDRKASKLRSYIEEKRREHPLLDISYAEKQAEKLEKEEFDRLYKKTSDFASLDSLIGRSENKNWLNLDEAKAKRKKLEKRDEQIKISTMFSFFTSLILLLICALMLFTTETEGFWSFFEYLLPAYLIICLQTMQTVTLVKVRWTKENIRPIFTGVLQGSTAGIAAGGSSILWSVLERFGLGLPEEEPEYNGVETFL